MGNFARSFIRPLVVFALVLTSMNVGSARAFAYCSGLNPGPGTWGAGGDQSIGSGLTQVTGYVQGRLPDPVITASAAWNMLHNTVRFAQGGWVRRAGWSSYYVFAAWINTAGQYNENYKFVTPTLSHNYGVARIGSTAYEFSYDYVPWLDSLDLGWTPTHIQIAGETHDSGDHFPGSIGYEVEYWGSQYVLNGTNYTASMSYNTTPPGNLITGIQTFSGNDFMTWDRRCSDAN